MLSIGNSIYECPGRRYRVRFLFEDPKPEWCTGEVMRSPELPVCFEMERNLTIVPATCAGVTDVPCLLQVSASAFSLRQSCFVNRTFRLCLHNTMMRSNASINQLAQQSPSSCLRQRQGTGGAFMGESDFS